MIFNNHLFSRLELKLNKVHLLLLNILSLVIFIVGEELFGSNPAEIDLDLTDIQKNPILLFFLVVVLAPLYEEFVNRSYLNNKKYILFIVIWIVFDFYYSDYDSKFRMFVYGFYVLILIFLYFSENLYRNQYFLLFLTTFFFSIFHLFRIVDYEKQSIFSNILSITPQFITGIFLFYVHKKYGFLAGVIHHGLINFRR
jgi:hypothetical protein